MRQKKDDLQHILSEQNKSGIPLAKIRQLRSEAKREQSEAKRQMVMKRRKVETVKREKLKYWHLIKRDVLKHKKEIATQEAQEKIRQAKRMTTWVLLAYLRQFVTRVWTAFSDCKHEKELLAKQCRIIAYA